MTDPLDELLDATNELHRAVDRMRFAPPVDHVYNPLEYARDPWDRYLHRFARSSKRVILMGMNPGPWGMAQTGIPFGEIQAVRDWMGVGGDVHQPRRVHPKRPIQGFECSRSEVSGRRLWGLMRTRFPDAETFFGDHFVTNYCPLVFMADTGRNITPDKLPADERAPLFSACDAFLARTIRIMAPRFVIGVGAFAAKRAHEVVAGLDSAPIVGTVLHPSPASPAANRGWSEAATRQLVDLGVWER